MTKALEQLENMGKGKETLRLKWKKRSSCRGWSWGGGGGVMQLRTGFQ